MDGVAICKTVAMKPEELSESGIINKNERSGCDRKDDVSEEVRARKNSY